MLNKNGVISKHCEKKITNKKILVHHLKLSAEGKILFKCGQTMRIDSFIREDIQEPGESSVAKSTQLWVQVSSQQPH